MRARLISVAGTFFLLNLLPFFVSVASVTEKEGQPMEKNVLPELPEEVQKMRAIFKESVGGEVATDANYLNQISQDAARRFLSLGGEAKRSQYFLYADRNPSKQIAFVGFFNATDGNVLIIGLDKISSGNEKRKGFFLTPDGIFKN